MSLLKTFLELLRTKAAKKAVFAFLEKILVKLVIKMMGISSSFPIFLMKEMTQYGFGKFVVPAMTALIRSGLYYYDVEKGELISKKLKEAHDNNDQDAYDAAADSVFHLLWTDRKPGSL